MTRSRYITCTYGRRASLLLMLVATILGSFGGLGIKWAAWEPMAINGVRSGFAALVMMLMIGPPKLRIRNQKQTLGIVAYAATLTLFVVATTLTTAANANLLL